MNILYISKMFPEARGVKWLASLEQKGHEVFVLVEEYKEHIKTWNSDPLIQSKINKMTFNNLISSLNEKAFIPNVIVLRDVFQIKTALKLKRHFNIKLIIDIADNYPEVVYQLQSNLYGRTAKIYFNYLEKKAISNAESIIVVTNESKEYLNKKYRNGYLNIEVVRNMPILKKEIEKDINLNILNPNKFIELIYIGNFNSKIRDFDTLFKALEKNGDLRLSVYSNQKNQISELGKKYTFSSEQLILNEQIKNEYLTSLLSKFHIGLIPHKIGEGTEYTEPNKLYDYVHANIAILGSDNLALKNTIEKYNIGEYYEAENVKDFIEKIYLVMSKKDFYIENQKKNSQYLTWENDFEKVLLSLNKVTIKK